MHRFFLFPPCGTMFPLDFSFAGDVTALWTLDAIVLIKGASIAWTRVHTITIKARALKEIYVNVIDVSFCDTWLREEALIFIEHAKSTEIVVPSRGSRFHRFREIGRRKSHCGMDGPHSSREFFCKN